MFSFGIFVVKFFNYLRNLGFIIKGDVFWKFFFFVRIIEIKIYFFVCWYDVFDIKINIMKK